MTACELKYKCGKSQREGEKGEGERKTRREGERDGGEVSGNGWDERKSRALA